MQETVIETFDDVKFIEGVTKMDQENWQAYFSAGFPNGIYEGLHYEWYDMGTPINRIYDGTAFVNGLCVTVKTEDGYTEYPTECATDYFLCLRVNLSEGTAKLVKKTEIASDYQETTLAVEIGKFLADESYCCERNGSIYDLPILYAGPSTAEATTTVHNYFKQGIDIRRMIKTKKDYKLKTSFTAGISGENKYEEDIGTAMDGAFARFNLIDIPDGAIIHITRGRSDAPFVIWAQPKTNSDYIWDNLAQAYTPSPVDFIFDATSDSWSNTSFPTGIQYNFTGGKTTLTLKIHFLGYTAPHGYSKAVYRFFLEELA